MVTKPTDEPRSDNREKCDFVNDTASLLAVRVKNIHSRRALLYKVSEDITECLKNSVEPYWTTAANCQYQKNLFDQKVDKNVKLTRGLHLEHPVPRSVMTDWLCGVKDDPTVPVDINNVRRAIELFTVTCWVTGGRGTEYYADSEEQALNKDKFKGWPELNIATNMPHGWCRLHGDPWDRYRSVRKQKTELLSDLTDKTIDIRVPSLSTCSCPPDSLNRVS